MADDGHGDPPVGAALAALRRRAGLTGHQLGSLAGMSQAKVSRLENGVGVLNPRDVEKIARALDAPEETIVRLVQRAQRADDRMTDWRTARGAITSMQSDIGTLEETATIFRVFQPAVVVGLAQTSEYARSVLAAAHELRVQVNKTVPVAAVPSAVAERLRRQTIVDDPAKQFRFVMAETVLANRICPPQAMIAQIDRLREIAARDNVTVRLLAVEGRMPFPPYHGFELLDDRRVIVDLYNTSLNGFGHLDTALYRYVFDQLENAATDDIEPILDRWYDRYLDLARRR